VVAAVLALLVAATPCGVLDDAVVIARRDRDAGSVTRAAALLPGPLSVRVRDELGRGGVDAALPLLERAVAMDCGVVEAPPTAAALQALRASDGRFVGVRADDLSERLLERLWRFVETLLESEGMQRFSEHTRTVYLLLLAFVCAFVGQRVWRRSRLVSAAPAGHDVEGGVEHRRRAAFSTLRQEALARLDADPRAALLLLRRALLVRVGEVDEGAVRPSRTSAEILARLGPTTASIVAPPLATFDRAYFGGAAVDVDDAVAARTLAAEVDAAAAALADVAREGR
jgi:hypothetical protein